VRQFAIRVRDEMQRIRGKEPTNQEWRDEVMHGGRSRRYSYGTRPSGQSSTSQSKLLGCDKSCRVLGASARGTPEPRRSLLSHPPIVSTRGCSPPWRSKNFYKGIGCCLHMVLSEGTPREHMCQGTQVCQMLWCSPRKESRCDSRSETV